MMQSRLLVAALLITASLQGHPAQAQATTVTLQVSVDPADDVDRLTLSRGTSPPINLLEGTAIGSGPVSFLVETSGGNNKGSLTAVWESKKRARIPLRFSSLFDEPVFVAVHERTLADVPEPAAVSEMCVQQVPSDIELAFEMFFSCREMALRLEREPKRKFGIVHLIALQGWFAANFFLYTEANSSTDPGIIQSRLTPFGADPDLVSRLTEILRMEDADPQLKWSVLQIGDARTFLKLVEDEDIRLIGWVPALKTIDPALANDLNEAALRAMRAGRSGGPYQVNVGVAERNAKDLQLLLQQVPEVMLQP